MPFPFCHPDILSILFAAMINGVLYCFKMFTDSCVCGLNPSLTSTMRTARSASDPPRDRSVVKA